MEEKNTIAEATDEGLDRREFALRTVMAMLSGVAITISGCGGGGGGSSPNAPNPQPSNGDKMGNVSADHGHAVAAVIRAAQLSAGGALTLDIRGQADHPHTLQLTAAEVASIAAGTRVGKASSEDAFHTHTVTFN